MKKLLVYRHSLEKVCQLSNYSSEKVYSSSPEWRQAQSDTAVGNIGCDAKSPEFIFRTFEIGVSHRDVYWGVLCL